MKAYYIDWRQTHKTIDQKYTTNTANNVQKAMHKRIQIVN